MSGWYAWLVRRGHIAASSAADITRPRPGSSRLVTPGLTRDQALALVRTADRAPGTQRARTAALLAVLLFTGARVSQIIEVSLSDLGLDQGRRVLRVTRHDARLDAYLGARGPLAGPGRPEGDAAAPLFATATGGRLVAADVWRTVRRVARRADCPA